MDHVSVIITRTIRQNMENRGFSLYFTDDDKLLAMDENFETHFKFDLVFSDNDFSCQILAQGEKGLELLRRFNISWTNARGLREFMEFVQNL